MVAYSHSCPFGFATVIPFQANPASHQHRFNFAEFNERCVRENHPRLLGGWFFRDEISCDSKDSAVLPVREPPAGEFCFSFWFRTLAVGSGW